MSLLYYCSSVKSNSKSRRLCMITVNSFHVISLVHIADIFLT